MLGQTLESIITCPQYGHQRAEIMPARSCVIAYDCVGCGVTLKPVEGDCCVSCIYGSVPCPPLQHGHDDVCVRLRTAPQRQRSHTT
jgi:hypothetical protein